MFEAQIQKSDHNRDFKNIKRYNHIYHCMAQIIVYIIHTHPFIKLFLLNTKQMVKCN